ncbi:lysine transporter LysE [Prauserella marina]|uniref:Threonine/homoserine/homoserine lactone efflux protein n=1 Tax=Prauserella marina TaxID=530584 RepID=A0A222VNH9_9PSEU|nr:LysE family translocator [Prauserella marina]ASR35470.1 lysine transporter LysE [Prauserella marina]PWV84712.1 threonine/homoserine/homoserine lactone efflux protein [Prauserella marina]SDC15097.1 Threonine/homoserine/homoserine lactone efflux protein [Prauserella marina]
MPTSAEWLIFLGTATLFAITPGPGILYVLARSMRGGRSEGIRSSLGNSLGAAVHVIAAALGLSALLATSAVAFTVVKIAGACYLVALGLHAILRRHDDGVGGAGGAEPATAGGVRRAARSPFGQGIITELLNPKTALYFMALLPHFVHPETAPAPLVFLVLGLIALAMALVADLAVALLAGTLGARLMASPRWRVRQRVASGLTMVGLGGFVAVAD